MEQVALRLTRTDGWTLLGGDPEAKKPVELVVRSFEHPVDVAAGDTDRTPDRAPMRVPAGEGRRVAGRWFFARPADPAQGPCLISYRGL
jgi:hypothetical protein